MSFRIALSGLNAASNELNVTANNIANVNTPGFKRSRAEFADVFANSLRGSATNQIGAGVRTARAAQQFSQGSIDFTDNPLDLAINGEGFFTMKNNGVVEYSRNGAFGLDKDGFVVNGSGSRLQIYRPNDNGGFDTGTLSDLQLVTSDSPPRATTTMTVSTNLPANATAPTVTPFDPTDADSYNYTTSGTVYDSLGIEHSASFYYVRTATDNQWEMHTVVEGTEIGTGTTLTYGTDGALLTPAGGQIVLPATSVNPAADPLTLTLEMGDSTQFGNATAITVNELTQDGFASGRLAGIDIDQTGVVQARFTNGQSTALGQVVLSNFSNPQGLQQLGDNAWAETYSSGQPTRGPAESSSFGSLQSGALEASNVDLTEQLVTMITAQRNFQANAQMITTADQVTQTVINIR
jgi:flagellar hook protein FlgE